VKTLWALVAIFAGLSIGLDFRRASFEGKNFTVIAVVPREDSVRQFLSDSTSPPLRGFGALRERVGADFEIPFAMNAGMYQPDFSPVGLFIEHGRILRAVNLDSGVGNFFLKPNGVFLIEHGKPQVIDAMNFPKRNGTPELALQSGPMLVFSDTIHPRFDTVSRHRALRNGVGVKGDTAFFAISDSMVTLFETARFFRDVLGCPNALYLDGTISSLYAPGLARCDSTKELGTLIGVLRHRPGIPLIPKSPVLGASPRR